MLLKMKSDSGSGSEKKRRILPESTPALRIRSHLWCTPFCQTKILGYWLRLFKNSS